MELTSGVAHTRAHDESTTMQTTTKKSPKSMTPPSAAKMVEGITPEAAIASMPVLWREAAMGPDGKPSRNQFAACMSTLKSRLGIGPDGKLPASVFTAMRAEAQRATANAVAGHHAGALYAKHSERFAIARHGIGGDNGPEVVAVRQTASAHQLTEAGQASGAARQIEVLRVRLVKLCESAEPADRESRNGVLSRAKKLQKQAEGFYPFAPKSSKLALRGWLKGWAGTIAKEVKEAKASAGATVCVGQAGGTAKDLVPDAKSASEAEAEAKANAAKAAREAKLAAQAKVATK